MKCHRHPLKFFHTLSLGSIYILLSVIINILTLTGTFITLATQSGRSL